MHYPYTGPRPFPCSVCRSLFDSHILRFVERDPRSQIYASPVVLCPACYASRPQ
jgi:hypothetical protein